MNTDFSLTSASEVGQKSDVTWLVFDVLFWAHMELQLGLLCASAPALRVFFRNYVSAPIRARQSSRRAPARLSHKDLDNLVIRRIDSPADQLDRYHFSAKPTVKNGAHSNTSVMEAEVDHSPVSSTLSSDHCVIRSPSDYEAYNLQNMELYRQSAHDRQGNKGRNFSQPFES